MQKKIILKILGDMDENIKFRKNMGSSSGYTVILKRKTHRIDIKVS